jgi:hypothetical protein
MRLMKLVGFLAGVSVLGLMTGNAFAADDSGARKALAHARKSQSALPGYLEHIIGYFPVMPGAVQVLTGTVKARLKKEVVDEVRNKMITATAKMPGAAELVERALAHLEEGASAEADQIGMLQTVVPDREIGTIQHSGNITRQVFADGYYEIVQNENRKAVRFNLTAQIALLRTQEVMNLTEAGVAEVKSVRDTIKGISFSMAQHTVVGSFGDALSIFDRVSELLTLVHAAKAMDQAAAMLEKMSGTWQCEPAPLSDTYPSKVTATEQLPDETLDGTQVHVYRESYILVGIQASNTSPADDDGPAAPPQLQRRTWVRISDSLPVRVELAFPGGRKQTMNYDYTTKIDIALPPCLTAP